VDVGGLVIVSLLTHASRGHAESLAEARQLICSGDHRFASFACHIVEAALEVQLRPPGSLAPLH
jgi:hypothetical protein